MDRRSFLHPRNLVGGTGQFLAVAEELTGAEEPAPVEEAALLCASRRAMATRFEILLPFDVADARLIAESAFNEIDRLEAQLTVYRDSSEVSRLNRLASSVAVPVEAGLFQLLSLAAQIHADTQGAYDVSAGALIKAWGFYRGPRRVPTDTELALALSQVGMQHAVLDHASGTVRFLITGLEINLGSIGKGYALDCAAGLLRDRWKLCSALLHGGHSSVYAMGTAPGDSRGWLVGIQHPQRLDRRLGVIRLRDRALGTSSATYQHLEHNGRRLGHILDPRTGWPAETMASATVLAPTAARADALATAFFILGVDKARSYCEKHPEIGAVLLPQSENAGAVILGLTPAEVQIDGP